MDPLLPSASDDGRRPPAPGRLELLRNLMNTVDLESRIEQFTAPEALASWLSERGLLADGTALTVADLSAAIDFRETVRDVLEANAGHGAATDALARLDRIAARVPLRVRLAGSPRLEPESEGVDAAIGRFLGMIYESVAQGTWPRLKVCRNDVCRWAFYDSSRNRSGTWCTMAICGNRMKGQTFRRRRSAGSSAD